MYFTVDGLKGQRALCFDTYKCMVWYNRGRDDGLGLV